MVGECASDAFRGWGARVWNEEFVIGNRLSFSTSREKARPRTFSLSLLFLSLFPFSRSCIDQRGASECQSPIRPARIRSSPFPHLLLRSTATHPAKHTPHAFYSAPPPLPISSVCPRRIYMQRRGGLFSE